MKKVAHIITRLTLGGAQETAYYYYHNHNAEKYDLYFLAGSENDFGDKENIDKFKSSNNVILISNMFNAVSPIKDIKALIEIYRFLKKNKIDIIQTHSSKAGILGRIAGKMAKVPVIIHTVHGWSFHERMSSRTKKAYVFLERLAARFTTKFIAVTKLDIEKGLKENIGNKDAYVVIRSGIDFNKFLNPDANKLEEFRKKYKGKKVVGTVGRLSRQKNPLDILKIAKMICHKRDDVHFVIVGDGELRGEVEEYIRQNKLENRVTLEGLKTEVQDFLQVFDVFLLTSLWEGLPRVIPEAMCCKVPVVANSVDGVAEIIKDGFNGFCTKPHDLIDACNKIEKLLDNPSVCLKITGNANDTIYPEYSASYMVSQMEKLYEDVYEEKMAKQI